MRRLCIPPLVVFGLLGCAGVQPSVTPEEGERIALACIEEVNAPGVYSLSTNERGRSFMGRLPMASPVDGSGGTQRGADAINSCTLTKAQGGSYEVEATPSGGTTVVNYTYGTPPSKSNGVRDRRSMINEMHRDQSDVSSFECLPNASVMQGGTQYCLTR